MRLGLSLVCLLNVVAAGAAAEAPTGAYTIPIAEEAPVWLGAPPLLFPTGLSSLWCFSAVCASASADIATDLSGAVTGTGLVVSLPGNVSGQVELKLAGKMAGTGANPRVALHFSAAGSAEDGISQVQIRGSGRLKCGIDLFLEGLGSSDLFCRTKARVCAFAGHRQTTCFALPMMVLAEEPKPFAIDLDLQTGAKGAVAGHATVEIAGGEAIEYAAHGRYDSRADTTNLELTGTDPAAKTKIRLRNVVLGAGSASAGTATFKIAGQRGRVELPIGAP